MKNTPGLVWNADFVIDTNVLSRTRVDDAAFDRLVELVRRMTAETHTGSGWFSTTSLLELLACSTPAIQMGLLRRFLGLSRAANGRVNVLAAVPTLIRQEWNRDGVLYIGRDALEAMLTRALDAGSVEGTGLDALRDDFLGFRDRQRAESQRHQAELAQTYASNPRFEVELRAALQNWQAPDAYGHCDDLAEGLVARYVEGAREISTELRNYEQHLTVWTFALMVRLAQIAQTIPCDTRLQFFQSVGMEVFAPDENDLIDAGIAATGANTGMIITEDRGLRDRINFLHARNLIRVQAFSIEVVAARWIAPPAGPREVSTSH